LKIVAHPNIESLAPPAIPVGRYSEVQAGKAARPYTSHDNSKDRLRRAEAGLLRGTVKAIPASHYSHVQDERNARSPPEDSNDRLRRVEAELQEARFNNAVLQAEARPRLVESRADERCLESSIPT